jgi:hypothetical protein
MNIATECEQTLWVQDGFCAYIQRYASESDSKYWQFEIKSVEYVDALSFSTLEEF